jgi:hypothetical protein
MGEDLSAIAAELRASGGDNTSIEVKAAAGGLPAWDDPRHKP